MTLTRREFGGLAMGALASGLATRTADAASAAPALPSGAIDCHIHIVGPQSKYPMAENRTYTPPEATIADLKKLREEIGVQRQVVVQPSFYGFDNRCTLDAVAELGRSARAVAVVPLNVSDAELQRLKSAGVVGIRLNFATLGIRNPEQAAIQILQLAPRVRPLGWHIQINTDPELISALAPIVAVLRMPVVFDHIGNPDASQGMEQPGFQALLEMVSAGTAYVKLSAPYNASKLPDYSDVTPFMKALIAARRERCLWGTNWPHPAATRKPIDEISPYQEIDNIKLVRLFMEWCPDEATRRMILVDTPNRLYQF